MVTLPSVHAVRKRTAALKSGLAYLNVLETDVISSSQVTKIIATNVSQLMAVAACSKSS